MKNWTLCIIASVVCRLLGFVAVLAFTYFTIVLTSSTSYLWLLLLLIAVELIPTYEFKHKTSDEEDTKENK